MKTAVPFTTNDTVLTSSVFIRVWSTQLHKLAAFDIQISSADTTVLNQFTKFEDSPNTQPIDYCLIIVANGHVLSPILS